jgi:hypothetical protein
MSGTKRVPIERRSTVQITERALDLWEAMNRLRCTCLPVIQEHYWLHKMCASCRRWYDLHTELNDELHCEPWQWPCVARASPKRAGSQYVNEFIATTMAALKAAAKARRAAACKEGANVDADGSSPST